MGSTGKGVGFGLVCSIFTKAKFLLLNAPHGRQVLPHCELDCLLL